MMSGSRDTSVVFIAIIPSVPVYAAAFSRGITPKSGSDPCGAFGQGHAKASRHLESSRHRILVVTAISTLGWLGANIGAASGLLLSAAVMGFIGLCVMIFLLHRRINRPIESLRDL